MRCTFSDVKCFLGGRNLLSRIRHRLRSNRRKGPFCCRWNRSQRKKGGNPPVRESVSLRSAQDLLGRFCHHTFLIDVPHRAQPRVHEEGSFGAERLSGSQNPGASRALHGGKVEWISGAGLRGSRVRVEKWVDGTVAVKFRDHYLPVVGCEAKPSGVATGAEKDKIDRPAQVKPNAKHASLWMKNFHLRQGPPLWAVLKHESGKRPARLEGH